jgi:hypothetical protein
MAEGEPANFVPNQKGGMNLQDTNNFKYRKLRDSKDKTIVTYQCVKCMSLKCPALAEYSKAKNIIIRRMKEHNHDPDVLGTAARYF